MRAEFTLLNRGRSHLTINATTIPPHGKVSLTIDMTAELLSTLMRQHIEVHQVTPTGKLVNMEILRGKVDEPASVTPVVPAPVVVAAPVSAEPVVVSEIVDVSTVMEVPTVVVPVSEIVDVSTIVEASTVVPVSETVTSDEDDEAEESPVDERRKELLASHGNTVKAIAKRLGIDGADGMKKDDLISKIIEIEFPA